MENNHECNKKSLFCCVRSFFRRSISLFLILAMMSVIMAVPVSAAENSTGNWIELLDYGTVNSTGTNVFSFSGSKVISLAFPTGSKAVGHVNVLLYSSQVISSAYVKDGTGTVHDFNVYPVGQGLYRIFGDLNQYIYSSLNLTVETSSSNTAHCEVLSARITTVIFNRKQVPAHATGTIYKTQPLYPSLTYPSSSALNWFSWVYDNLEDYQYQGWNGSFQFNLYLDDWEEYDFIDIEITGQWENLNSIRTELDNLAIPYEASNVYSVDGVRSGVFITLDLRNVDRRYTGQPIVTITGSGYYNPSLPDMNGNMFSIDGIYGYIQENDPEPLGYWMRNVKQHFTSLFNSLSSSLGSSISSLGTNIDSWINAQTTSISTMLTNLRTNIGTYITEQTTAISNAIAEHTSNVFTMLLNMYANIGNFFTTQTNSLTSAITSGVDRIVDAITGGDNADDLQQGADQIGEAGSSLGSNIGSIQDFEDQYFGQLDTNMSTIIAGGNISGIVAPLAFVRRYTNMIVAAIPSNFLVIFTLPILLGIFMYIVGHPIRAPRPDTSGDTVTRETFTTTTVLTGKHAGQSSSVRTVTVSTEIGRVHNE